MPTICLFIFTLYAYVCITPTYYYLLLVFVHIGTEKESNYLTTVGTKPHICETSNFT